MSSSRTRFHSFLVPGSPREVLRSCCRRPRRHCHSGMSRQLRIEPQSPYSLTVKSAGCNASDLRNARTARSSLGRSGSVRSNTQSGDTSARCRASDRHQREVSRVVKSAWCNASAPASSCRTQRPASRLVPRRLQLRLECVTNSGSGIAAVGLRKRSGCKRQTPLF